jgi:hypothetical protein
VSGNVTITVTNRVTVKNTITFMRLFSSDIKRLQMLSTANFKKQICACCGEEFFSFRDCLYCHQSCKQMAYRKRLLNNDSIIADVAPIEEKRQVKTHQNSFDEKELDEKIEKYTNNLNQIKYGRP